MKTRVFSLFFVLCSFLATTQAFAEDPIIVSAECGKEKFGTSTLTSDGKNVVVCLIADDGIRYIWKSSTTKAASLPVGAVIAWPALIDPPDMDNWLECKGQIITQSAYPELYAVVGGRVPDYRGLFLRGLGSQSFSQNNGTNNNGLTTTVYSSAQIGLVQGDATRNIQGYFYGDLVTSGGVFQNASTGDGRTRAVGVGAGLYSSIFDNARVAPIAAEIRPVNTAVRYLIRAKS